MTTYAALLRGVSPMNCKMPELRRAYEAAGFDEVSTVLASGNVVFATRSAKAATLEKRCETATEEHLGRRFATIVRPISALRAILDAAPYGGQELPPGAKRVVTFLRKPPGKAVRLPIEVDGARILAIIGGEVFTVYVPSPRGAVFMTLLEKTFGKDITTRTWETVTKIVAAGS